MLDKSLSPNNSDKLVLVARLAQADHPDYIGLTVFDPYPHRGKGPELFHHFEDLGEIYARLARIAKVRNLSFKLYDPDGDIIQPLGFYNDNERSEGEP